MKIVLTLSEVLKLCNNWVEFCDEQGWDEYAVKNGGGDVEVELSINDVYKYGILSKHDVDREYGRVFGT